MSSGGGTIFDRLTLDEFAQRITQNSSLDLVRRSPGGEETQRRSFSAPPRRSSGEWIDSMEAPLAERQALAWRRVPRPAKRGIARGGTRAAMYSTAVNGKKTSPAGEKPPRVQRRSTTNGPLRR